MSTSLSEVLIATEGKDSDNSPSGLTCYFVKLSEEWGVKIYQCEYKRNQCRAFQAAAAEHGLAPRVGEQMDLPDGKFAYITESVVELTASRWGSDEEYYQLNKANRELAERITYLTGIPLVDNHIYNFGYLADGRLVAIDFGND